jgi:hypothetical protein
LWRKKLVLHGMRVVEDFVGCRGNPITLPPAPGKEQGFVSAKSLCNTRRTETMASGRWRDVPLLWGSGFAVGCPVPVACGELQECYFAVVGFCMQTGKGLGLGGATEFIGAKNRRWWLLYPYSAEMLVDCLGLFFLSHCKICLALINHHKIVYLMYIIVL